MAKGVAAERAAGEAAGAVALAEPASFEQTVRMHALDTMDTVAHAVERLAQRYLPHLSSDEPAVAAGPDLGFSVINQIVLNGGAIGAMVASPDGRRLFVTNCGADSVAVIDTASSAVLDTVTGTTEPFAIAMGADRAYVRTVSAAYDAISVVDTATNTVTDTYPLALNVDDLIVSPDGTRVYASRTGVTGADVAVLDVATGRIDAIDLAAGPGVAAGCLGIDRAGRRLYVAVQRPFGNEVAVIDTDTADVLDVFEVRSPIRGIAVSPDGATAYVAGCDPALGGVVEVIDTRTGRLTGTVHIGGLLTQLVLSHDGDRAFVVNGDVITVLCTRSRRIVGTLALAPDASPSCVAESPDGGCLYVADYAGAVTVVAIAPDDASSATGICGQRAVAELQQLPPAV